MFIKFYLDCGNWFTISSLKTLYRYYNNILIALHLLFGPNESDEAVRDNASGAVARMIMAQPHAIPFSQVVQYRYRFVDLIL